MPAYSFGVAPGRGENDIRGLHQVQAPVIGATSPPQLLDPVLIDPVLIDPGLIDTGLLLINRWAGFRLGFRKRSRRGGFGPATAVLLPAELRIGHQQAAWVGAAAQPGTGGDAGARR